MGELFPIIENVKVDLKSLISIQHKCDPEVCKEKISCCAEYEVCIEKKEVYKIVLNNISKIDRGNAIRYKYRLKESIMKLGPNGFAFENYVGNILEHYGLKIKGIRSKVKGKCSNHEIDLIAISNKKKFMIECKHNSTRGGFIGLKVP